MHKLCCDDCEAALPRLDANCCPICALPTLNAAVCGQCLRTPPHFLRTVAVYSYEFPIDKLIHAYKYHAKLHLSQFFAHKLANQVTVLPDCLLPMPLHPSRLKERGFNQSLLLARDIGRQLQLPVLAFTCLRIRDTPSQSNLPWADRRKNILKAFTCKAEVEGKHVAIVDDVMTTGATMNELAGTLLKAGATEVSVWIVARTRKS